LLVLVAVLGLSINSYGLVDTSSSYVKEIRVSPQYDNYVTGEISVGIPDSPIDVSARGNGGWWLVGHVYNCEWALATCDQGRVGFVPLE
jgi:hypothetical protein